MTPGYGTILRRHLGLVTLFAIAGVLFGAWFNTHQDHYYEASTDVVLSAVASPFRSSDGTKADLSRALQTQIDIATGDEVRARVKGTPGEDVEPVVALNGERDELRFTCKADDAKTAAAAANAWAAAYVAELQAATDDIVKQYRASLNEQYIDLSKEIQAIDAQRPTAPPAQRATLDLRRDVLVTQLKALASRRALDDTSVPGLLGGQVVRKAHPPSSPANDEPLRDLLLGLGAGLVLGYLAAALVEARRDQVRTADDVALAVPAEPVLGPVATGKDLATVARLSAGTDYASLRADALAVAADVNPPVLAVLGASGDVDAAPVALGLALALRRQGLWVLLVDAETVREGTAELLPADASPGLAGVLFDEAPVTSSVTTVHADDGTDLLVLPTGGLSVGGLAAPAFGAVVDQLIADHQLDAVVVSAGAATGDPDATAVAVAASSVLVVAALRRTRRRQLAASQHRLDLLAPKPRAVVLAKTASRAKGHRQDKRSAPAVPDPGPQRHTAEEGLSGVARGRK